jgi:acetyl-CoA decarbonylase/synthase complex subunit beta
VSAFKVIPVDVGVIYSGENIRYRDMWVQFGGPLPRGAKHKFELVQVKGPEEIEDGKIVVIGPDINEMDGGSTSSLGIYVEVSGSELEKDLEGVIERRIHEYTNYIEGTMHLNQRYDLYVRISKASYEKGFNSFKIWGKVLGLLYKAELPIVEKIQITFISDPSKVEEMKEEALKVYEERDARARGLLDEDVDAFYGCVLCQSFAPTHVCIVAPNRFCSCGAVSWFDARASARIDPKGPNFRIDKGECLDSINGEWSGVNEVVASKSLGEVNRVWLYSMFGYPHTSCGCFEGIAFYIPELEGIGIVHRDFTELCVNGLSFATMSDHTGGGRQSRGFNGISIEYLRSPKFFQADGGWNKVVWMPKEIKERVRDGIPEDIIDQIATENDAKTIDELKDFLVNVNHPVLEIWKAKEEVEEQPIEAKAPLAVPSQEGVISMPTLPLSVGGLRIILKNVRIHAEKAIIRREE